MADIRLPGMTTRHVACNVVLQLHGGIDPDTARSLSDRIVFAVDRAGMRGHADAAPTEDEIQRARMALHRHGHDVGFDDVAVALDAAFVRGWHA
jgi:hypothetical protein